MRPETRLSDMERDLSGDVISTRDMDLKAVARFNTFDIMGSGYIVTRK
jgi:hypothetical protein